MPAVHEFGNAVSDVLQCDLSRPCQTCRDRDHPELCSYHPPNKRQNVDGNAQGHPMQAPEDGNHYAPPPYGAGSIVLGRNEFDLLCRKLNGLENSIAEMKRELRRNKLDHNGQSDSDATTSNDGNRAQTHTDLHGLHTKNESVCIAPLKMTAHQLTSP